MFAVRPIPMSENCSNLLAPETRNPTEIASAEPLKPETKLAPLAFIRCRFYVSSTTHPTKHTNRANCAADRVRGKPYHVQSCSRSNGSTGRSKCAAGTSFGSYVYLGLSGTVLQVQAISDPPFRAQFVLPRVPFQIPLSKIVL